jgi:hypothetical protein
VGARPGLGLVDVEVDASVRVFRPSHPCQRLLLRFVELHRDRILAAGLLGPAELDGGVRRLGAHLADTGTSTLYSTLFTAWGRTP